MLFNIALKATPSELAAKCWITGFIFLTAIGGWIGYLVIGQSQASPLMKIVAVQRYGSGFRMNLEFPDGKSSKVNSIDHGKDVVIELVDGEEFRVSGPISHTAALNPVFNLDFSPTDCSGALSDGDRFRLGYKLGVHYDARLGWFAEHLPANWLPRGDWFFDHSEENQLVISDWFQFTDNPHN